MIEHDSFSAGWLIPSTRWRAYEPSRTIHRSRTRDGDHLEQCSALLRGWIELRGSSREPQFVAATVRS
jgi:hypothetical protein